MDLQFCDRCGFVITQCKCGNDKNTVKNASNILTKNEYLALELTKAWLGEKGASYMSSVLHGYDTALKHFEENEKKDEN